jgi:hypothetical protein
VIEPGFPGAVSTVGPVTATTSAGTFTTSAGLPDVQRRPGAAPTRGAALLERHVGLLVTLLCSGRIAPIAPEKVAAR